MRIAIGLAELVVHTVIAAPDEQIVLTGDRVADHQENAQWQTRFVTTMRP